MPNLCYYQMKIKGSKPNRDAFIKKLEDYDEPNHFWRIFQVLPFEETDESIQIEGDLAWSVYSCCISGYTDIDLLAVNTRDLNLSVEIYSEETGMGFQEHYLYQNGIQLINECEDMYECWYDRDYYSSFEDFKTENDLPDTVTEDDLIDGAYYKEGGFEEWSWNI